MWKILETGRQSVKENMRFDEKLLEDLTSNDLPILRFYDFTHPSATFGHFIRPEDHIDMLQASRQGLTLFKRPTGGGFLFHLWDMTFSVLIPASHPGYSQDTLRNYQYINQAVLIAIQEFIHDIQPLSLLPENPHPLDHHTKAFCMAKPTKYDVMLCGRKVAGAAQRRKKQGYLHQGSISLCMPNFSDIEQLLLPGTQVLEAMKIHTFSLLGVTNDQHAISEARCEMQRHLQKAFQDL